jgi:hypothetical protein
VDAFLDEALAAIENLSILFEKTRYLGPDQAGHCFLYRNKQLT